MRWSAWRHGWVVLALAGLVWHGHRSMEAPARLGVADRAVMAVSGPLQAALNGAGTSARDALDRYVRLGDVADENARLRGALARVELERVELDELRLENDRLRSLNGLREVAPGRSIGATVVGRGTHSRFKTLRIDRGEQDGLETGQAVVTVRGAVGQVLRVGRAYADVMLITDGLSAAGALVQDSRLRGVATGRAGGELALCFVQRSEHDDLSEGALVLTSGDDGIFPPGVPVGRVSSVQNPETGLFLDVALEPAVDLERISEVLVLTELGVGPFRFPGDERDEEAISEEWEPAAAGETAGT